MLLRMCPTTGIYYLHWILLRHGQKSCWALPTGKVTKAWPKSYISTYPPIILAQNLKAWPELCIGIRCKATNEGMARGLWGMAPEFVPWSWLHTGNLRRHGKRHRCYVPNRWLSLILAHGNSGYAPLSQRRQYGSRCELDMRLRRKHTPRHDHQVEGMANMSFKMSK